MLHLIGQPLAIDTFTYLQFLQSHKAGQVTESRQVTKEPVKMFASAQINNYTQRELGWLGIQTAEGKDGLVAMITIRGATQRYSDWYQDGTEWVAQQIDICNGNPLVNSMLLRIDSPGGAVNGSQVLAATIRTSPKPILGWGSNMAASAAFWYLSQCQECYIENEFTAVGSIGIMSIYRDVSEANEKAGEIRDYS
jgi:protease-4